MPPSQGLHQAPLANTKEHHRNSKASQSSPVATNMKVQHSKCGPDCCMECYPQTCCMSMSNLNHDTLMMPHQMHWQCMLGLSSARALLLQCKQYNQNRQPECSKTSWCGSLKLA